MSPIYIAVAQIAARYDVHPSTVWRWAKADPNFPQPVTLTPGCTRWRLSELEIWEATKAQAD